MRHNQFFIKKSDICQVLTSNSLDPRQKAGALHMVGAVADVLLTKKIYKDQAEMMIVNHVLPEFGSEHGYLRARVSLVTWLKAIEISLLCLRILKNNRGRLVPRKDDLKH